MSSFNIPRKCILAFSLAVFFGAAICSAGLLVRHAGVSVQSGPPVDFGIVGAGTSPAVLSFTLYNTGTEALTNIILSVPTGYATGPNPLATTVGIAPNNEETFEIQLLVEVVGVKDGNAVISCDQLEDFYFPLTGEVQAPAEIRVTDQGSNEIADNQTVPLDFGRAILGLPGPTQTFTVYNDGSAPLTIGTVNLPAGFSLSETLNSTIAPGLSDTFEVSLNTTTLGIYQGEISFTNADGGEDYGDMLDENPFNFAITGMVVQEHDECENAIEVEVGVPYTGSTSGATGTMTSSCGSNDTLDVWHSFTPDFDYDYTISLCGSSFDTTLAIYDSCGGNELACNDDAGTEICQYKWPSQVTMPVQQGITYFVRIAGYDGQTGNYQLLISGPVCTAAMPSDFNGDCITDINDFAVFASYWMQCNIDPPEACY